MISQELKLNSADETESQVVQHPEITETSIIASKHVEEQVHEIILLNCDKSTSGLEH